MRRGVILSGHGRMGRLIEEQIVRSDDLELLGVVDTGLFESPNDVPGKVEGLIDFSYPGNLDGLLRFATERNVPLVLGTTGYDERQLARVREAAKTVAIVQSSNYSAGVAAVKAATRLLKEMLGENFDVEIVEAHHNQKADAPSGTAKMLLEAVDPANEYAHVFGREGATGARGKEIGVHALRGGTVAGTHSVFFFGPDETVEIRHSAASRQIFVSGALRALRFVMGKPAGLYAMEDVLRGEKV